MSDTVIAADMVVALEYTLRDGDASGEILDQAAKEEPLLYLHGGDNIIPGLEAELDGKAVGAAFELGVAPEDGYGLREETEPQMIPRSSFPEDMPVEAGVAFGVENEDGEPVPLWIVKVEGDEIFVDMNHPLAGKTLHFTVEVLSIRKATKDELEHGHPHGPTGHEGHGH